MPTPTRSRRQKGTTASRDEQVTALKEQLDEAVSALVTSEAWQAMLDSAIRLTRYSFRNIMLITQQCPHATQVAAYREWQNRGRQVRKGERGIRILAPMTRRQDEDDEPEHSGSEKEEKGRPRVYFRPISVFDISQTDRADGEPEEYAPGEDKLTGEAPARMWECLARYVESLGYTVERGPCDGADGHTNPETRTVRISETDDPAHAAVTLAHEAAHIERGHVDEMDEYRKHRGQMETEAESIAYIIAGALGLDAAATSVPYVAGWSGATPEEVSATIKAIGHAVVTAARSILDAITDAASENAEQEAG